MRQYLVGTIAHRPFSLFVLKLERTVGRTDPNPLTLQLIDNLRRIKLPVLKHIPHPAFPADEPSLRKIISLNPITHQSGDTLHRSTLQVKRMRERPCRDIIESTIRIF